MFYKVRDGICFTWECCKPRRAVQGDIHQQDWNTHVLISSCEHHVPLVNNVGTKNLKAAYSRQAGNSLLQYFLYIIGFGLIPVNKYKFATGIFLMKEKLISM